MIRRTIVYVFSILLLLGTEAVRLRDDASLDASSPPKGTKYCVDVSKGESICSSDPMMIQGQGAAPSVIEETNLGVDQRIDGTESEKNAIKDVIRLMNAYWYEEVLSNHDYEGVRTGW